MVGVSGATQLIGGAVTGVNVTDCDIAGVDAANVGHARHPLEAAQQTCGDAIGIVVGSPAICKRRGGAYPAGVKAEDGLVMAQDGLQRGRHVHSQQCSRTTWPTRINRLVPGNFFSIIDAIASWCDEALK